MKLSIAMIVKNEERNLERTLKPLKELNRYIDTEIVIVDTGSEDKTVDIAKIIQIKFIFINGIMILRQWEIYQLAIARETGY